jgi:hypothetical protein
MDSTRPPVPPEETPATPGSPSATVTIDGKQLPPPPMKFGGVINEDAKNSKAYWPSRVVPPKGAPNVHTRTPVDDSYELPFHFTGTINKLTFKLGPEQLMAADHAEALASVHS